MKNKASAEKSNAYKLGYNDGYCRGEQSPESNNLNVQEEAAYLRGFRAGQQDSIEEDGSSGT